MEFLTELWRSTGVKPQALKNRPEVKPALYPMLLAFYEVSSGRSYTMSGPQPIPASELLAYFQVYGVDDLEERERLFRMMRRLDVVYLLAQQKKNEAK